MGSKSRLESQVRLILLAEDGLAGFEEEYRFHPTRRWRFDFAWPEAKVALEVEGGVWVGGRHNRGYGYLGDVEKYNEAALHGWTLIRATPEYIRNGKMVEWLRRALE